MKNREVLINSVRKELTEMASLVSGSKKLFNLTKESKNNKLKNNR